MRGRGPSGNVLGFLASAGQFGDLFRDDWHRTFISRTNAQTCVDPVETTKISFEPQTGSRCVSMWNGPSCDILRLFPVSGSPVSINILFCTHFLVHQMVLVSNKHKNTRKNVKEKSCSVQNYIYIKHVQTSKKHFPICILVSVSYVKRLKYK